MFGRNREMHIHLTVLIGSIQCSFYQVLFQWRAAAVFILMELQQSFGQSAIVQSGCFEQGSNNRLVVSGGSQSRYILSGSPLASGIQVIIEGKLLYFLKESLFKACLGSVIVCPEKFKQVLEHTAGSTRSRHKLHHHFIGLCICLPGIQVFFLFIRIRSQYTLFYRSGGRQLQVWKTFFETSQLFGYLFFGDAFIFEQLFVLRCYHNILFY